MTAGRAASWWGMSRRSFVGAMAAGGTVAVLGGFRRLAVGSGDDVGAAEVAPLAPAAVETLKAFAFVLIPSSFSGADAAKTTAASAVVDAALQDLASDSAADLGDAAAFLDAQSTVAHGVHFTALDGERRRRLVDGLVRPYTTRTLFSNPYYYVTEDGRRVRRLWCGVAEPLIAAFYTSRLGWQVVGYPRRPGECSNLTDYQLPVT